MTVLEAIQRSTEFLTRKGIESPRLQAELLLAHVLNLPRMKLYLGFERSLSDPEMDALRELVRRRGLREPVQYILGATSFCGLELSLNRHVLIPRPETELLAEQGWEYVNGRSSADTIVRVVDFGTGSGCLAIAIAVHSPRAKILALDLSSDALQFARQNAHRHSVSDRIEFLQAGSLPQAIPAPSIDLLISNPPYIATTEIETLQPEVKDYEPRLALDGGADGLDWFRHLAISGRPLLNPGGRAMLEFGDGQAKAIEAIFQNQNWIVDAILEDYTQRPRILIARTGA